MRDRKSDLHAKSQLMGAALIWGSSFFIVKNTVDDFAPNILIGFRFTIACLLLALIFHKRLLRCFNMDYIKRGLIIGLCLFCAYAMQTIGITDTTPGKNAFLTAIYCVIVPFLYWIVDRNRPNIYNFLAAFVCIAGIGLVSLTSQLTISWGDSLTLIGGFFYAAHVVAVARLSRGHDPIVLTILQFAVVAVLGMIIGLAFEEMPAITALSADSIGGLLYLTVMATAVALLLQNTGQKGTDPSSAAIILSLESVFGVLFSVLFYHEVLTARLLCGFVLIFIAVLISETLHETG